MNNRNKNRSNFYAMKDCSYLLSMQLFFFSLAGSFGKDSDQNSGAIQSSAYPTVMMTSRLMALITYFTMFILSYFFVFMHLLKNRSVELKAEVLRP